jgi:hypothetical protein
MRLALVLLLLSCGSEPDDLSLDVTWGFSSGDCASNQVDQVRVKWGMSGALDQTVDFACSKGEGKLGDLSAMGGTYGIIADGLDSAGVARFTHFGTTLTVKSGGTHGGRPHPAAEARRHHRDVEPLPDGRHAAVLRRRVPGRRGHPGAAGSGELRRPDRHARAAHAG